MTQIPSEKKFGGLFTAIFLGAACFGAYSGWSPLHQAALATAGIATLLITLARPHALAPFNRAWYKLGILLGKIVSPVVMGLIFFLLITPIALVTRMLGRDELRLKRGNRNTYWIDRSPPGPSSESFKNQF